MGAYSILYFHDESEVEFLITNIQNCLCLWALRLIFQALKKMG